MQMELTLETIETALGLPDFDVLTAHRQMMPTARNGRRPPTKTGRPRIGCVMLLLYCHEEQFHIVLTRRRENLNAHAGQISFPGGRLEPGETFVETALRETHEEIGVAPETVQLLGELSSIYIPPSDFEVHPFVGWVAHGRPPSFIPQESEVAEVLQVPLSHLLNPETRKVGCREFQGTPVEIPYFDVDGHVVWGATAIMLSEFVERLRLCLTA